MQYPCPHYQGQNYNRLSLILSTSHSHELMAQLESEELAKEKDAKAKTPTLTALREFNSSDLRPMVSGAASLLRQMEKVG